MKILIFNTLYYPNQIGGAEKSVQLLAEGLLKDGKEPIVVTTSDKDCINYINGVKVYYIKTINLYWVYNAKKEKKYKKPIWHLIDSYNPFNKKINDVIEVENPDVVHTNNLAGFSVSVWKLAKDKDIKIVHTLRDYYLLCPKSTMFNEKLNKNCEKQCLACKLYSMPRKKYSKYVDVVVGVSKFILNKHLRYGYFKNVNKSVIYNSVEVPTNFKKKNMDKKEIIFGYVGTLSKSKGIEFLLENFKNLDLKNTKLFIYGKGLTKEYENYLKQKYQDKDLIFKGFKKPQDIYKNIDILIVPSLWNEPFGRIVPEANSYGIPVLASDTGGLSELVENGKNGYLFDLDKENDFEEKLRLTIEMYKKKQFEFNTNLFSLDTIINEYINLYSC
ncbi:Glycosyltransferase involved in cell wall bisynthesis [Desulfonauticus submarinus]|uniref:Glycosyltransferase involved in cell wall bisynthesis n=1 Tax=Desulfonauticus submarinus TaxID=206665 RepID=A0A1H0BYR2_9BACT|nr:glycosyltransferase family 4 protein [Desulfonauticus submarinus]SDN50838.1 Glycosyltransferase involved in cell wall bisynthesis [Desulfonauticus submarinus]